MYRHEEKNPCESKAREVRNQFAHERTLLTEKNWKHICNDQIRGRKTFFFFKHYFLNVLTPIAWIGQIAITNGPSSDDGLALSVNKQNIQRVFL